MAVSVTLSKKDSQDKDRSDLVAYWSVPLCDGVHTIEFEHGTLSGKRVLRVDGKEIIRRDWMFKLVGDENFTIGKQRTKCILRVEPLPNFNFGYTLLIEGQLLKKFTEVQGKILRSWTPLVGGKRYRVVLEKHTLDIWVNGCKVEAESEFVEKGTEMKFFIGEHEAIIRATSSDPKLGVHHKLIIKGQQIDEDPN